MPLDNPLDNYMAAESKLNGRDRRKLENNTYLIRLTPTSIGVKLHATYVVVYHADGRVVLNSGGWQTHTTKDRLNKYSPVRIYQEKHVWYVPLADIGNRKRMEYYDGLTFLHGGIVQCGPSA